MGTLISVDELASRIGDSNLRIFDCRFSLADPMAGNAQYREGHLRGASYADLNTDLSAPVVPGRTGRHPLPTREGFALRLGTFGVSNAHRVVAYDDASGAFAARLWWMLRWLGHSDVAVLDGGIKAWTEAGHEVVTDVPSWLATTFDAKAALTRTVSADELPSSNSVVLDARDEARYRGENEPIDPVAGHIPGALCAPFTQNLTGDLTFKDAPALREQFVAHGVSASSSVICYCGSGVTATHNILAMVQAGFAEPALYPGSWSEWVTDDKRPVERG